MINKGKVFFCDHDDVIKWKYFPRYWPFVWGIHRSPVNSPHTKASGVELRCFLWSAPETNGWINTRDAGDLRRRCAHNDVTLMHWNWHQLFSPLPFSSNVVHPLMVRLGSICTPMSTLYQDYPRSSQTSANVHYAWARCRYVITVGLDDVTNHQPHHCLINRLFRRKSKNTSKPRVTCLCAGNSPFTGEFPPQMTSNAENVSIWWRHRVMSWCHGMETISAPLQRDLTDDESTLLQVMSWCAVRQQAIAWSTVELVLWRHMASLGHNELHWLFSIILNNSSTHI